MPIYQYDKKHLLPHNWELLTNIKRLGPLGVDRRSIFVWDYFMNLNSCYLRLTFWRQSSNGKHSLSHREIYSRVTFVLIAKRDSLCWFFECYLLEGRILRFVYCSLKYLSNIISGFYPYIEIIYHLHDRNSDFRCPSTARFCSRIHKSDFCLNQTLYRQQTHFGLASISEFS